MRPNSNVLKMAIGGWKCVWKKRGWGRGNLKKRLLGCQFAQPVKPTPESEPMLNCLCPCMRLKSILLQHCLGNNQSVGLYIHPTVMYLLDGGTWTFTIITFPQSLVFCLVSNTWKALWLRRLLYHPVLSLCHPVPPTLQLTWSALNHDVAKSTLC